MLREGVHPRRTGNGPLDHAVQQAIRPQAAPMLARLARARLLRAVAPASALTQRSLVAGRVGRRQLAVATAARFSVASPSQAPPVLAEAAGAAPSSADAAAAEAQESAPMDLSEVGAESSKVLTIADVLSTRESEVLAAAGSAGLGWFEEWESVSGSETVHDAVALMVERNIGSLIVTEENAGVVGIVTERDVLTKMSPRSVLTEEKLVRDIMSSHIMCIHPSTTVIDALATMTKENIRHLAVLHGELSTVVKKGSVPEEAMRCVLSITDILKAYSRFEAQKKTPKVESADAAASATVEAAPTTEGAAESTEEAPPTTAATLLKKKAKHVKLILNTRPEDNISVADAVDEMRKHNFGAVLVVDKEQRVQGIFTERDYLLKVLFEHKDPTQVRLTDVASTVRTYLQIEDPLEKCWNLAVTEDCRHFPVIGVMRKDREKELAGILSIKDIVREISKGHETSTGFRLMDFFKSKRDSLKQEPKSEQPKPEQAVAAAVAAAAVEATASAPSAPAEDSLTSTESKSEVASSSGSEVATEAVEKKD